MIYNTLLKYTFKSFRRLLYLNITSQFRKIDVGEFDISLARSLLTMEDVSTLVKTHYFFLLFSNIVIYILKYPILFKLIIYIT